MNSENPEIAKIAKIAKLRNALREAGLDYVLTRTEGGVVHVNVWIGEGDGH